MISTPDGLWPFTLMVVKAIEKKGGAPVLIEAHDQAEPEEPDFIWGELTPHLELSDGEYLRIDQEFGEYCACFGTRGCSGGDPTYEDMNFLAPTAENAGRVAIAFVEHFGK